MNDNTGILVVFSIVASIVGAAIFAAIFAAVFGASKSRWYQSKQLEITIRMGKMQGMTDEEIENILKRPSLKDR